MDSPILNKEVESNLSQLESGKALFLICRELRDKGISINDSRFISDYAQHKLIIKHSKPTLGVVCNCALPYNQSVCNTAST